MAEGGSKVHSVRCSDEDWAIIQESAAERGESTNAYLVRTAAHPSFADALAVIGRATSTEEDRAWVAANLAPAPRLELVGAETLRALARGLTALASRWPR